MMPENKNKRNQQSKKSLIKIRPIDDEGTSFSLNQGDWNAKEGAFTPSGVYSPSKSKNLDEFLKRELES